MKHAGKKQEKKTPNYAKKRNNLSDQIRIYILWYKKIKKKELKTQEIKIANMYVICAALYGEIIQINVQKTPCEVSKVQL